MTEVEGLPDAATDGRPSALTITGDLTLKETTAPVTFTGQATMDEDKLYATMSTTLLMSEFDIGPINIAGLVHTSNEIEMDFVFEADRVALDSAAPDESELAVAPSLPEHGEGNFSEGVQPILEARCVSCHTTVDGPGSTTWALDTAGDAARGYR